MCSMKSQRTHPNLAKTFSLRCVSYRSNRVQSPWCYAEISLGCRMVVGFPIEACFLFPTLSQLCHWVQDTARRIAKVCIDSKITLDEEEYVQVIIRETMCTRLLVNAHFSCSFQIRLNVTGCSLRWFITHAITCPAVFSDGDDECGIRVGRWRKIL